jgi:hypothetical protein
MKENNETTPEPASRRRGLATRAAAVFGGAIAMVAMVAGPSFATGLPSPTSVATSIVNTGGGQLVSTAVGVIPVVIGILVIFWAIRFALHKLGFGGRAKV